MEFVRPIAYLERSDFTSDGNLSKTLTGGNPVLVMVQSNKCGHCIRAKPEFQALADSGEVLCATISTDGDKPTERAIMPFMSTIYPDFQGVPTYILFLDDGSRIPYMSGDRSANSLLKFVQETLESSE